MGYGKEYFIIQSVFMDRVPPPRVHMHFRMFDVATSVPIGDLSGAGVTPPGSTTDLTKKPSASAANGHAVTTTPVTSIEVDVPENERLVFDEWLRNLWSIKDQMIDAYHRSGLSSPEKPLASEYSTNEDSKAFASAYPAVEIPVKLVSCFPLKLDMH